MTDILEGVTTKTTKDDLLKRLRKAADLLHKAEDARAGELEARLQGLRERHEGAQKPLLSVTVASTEEEFTDMVEFLSDIEDMLPHALARLLAGTRAHLNAINS